MAEHDDEKVGYGRPPRKHRFKAGQSGNPKGRPKGSHHSPKTVDVSKVFLASTRVQVNGQQQQTTYLEATLVKLISQALNGDRRSTIEVIKLAKDKGLLATAPGPAFSLDGARVTLARKLDLIAEWHREQLRETAEQAGGLPGAPGKTRDSGS